MRKTILLAATAVAAIAAIPASAAPIFYEDFEEAPYQFVLAGQAQVLQGSDYGPCCGVTGSQAALDNHFVSFGSGNQPSGVAFTTSGLTAGETYTVKFYYGALAGSDGQNDPLTLSVGNTSVRYDTSSNRNLDQTFQYGFYTFIAGAGNTAISFQSQGTGNVDAVLDRVSLVAGGVPEPATWAMMIAGFGLVGGLLRRRKATVAYA